MTTMMDCAAMGGLGGTLMLGIGILAALLLILAIAALVKYLFWGGRAARPGER
jgi:hypothetical protein